MQLAGTPQGDGDVLDMCGLLRDEQESLSSAQCAATAASAGHNGMSLFFPVD